MEHNRLLLLIVVISNISFIILHIHKYNTIAQLNDLKQNHQLSLAALTQQKDSLAQELCDLHDRKTIMRYAQQYLDMAPVCVDQILKTT